MQPLDFLIGRWVLGFGFATNFTLVDQVGTGAQPPIALGVAPHTYNVTGYYEHGPWSARLSTVYNRGTQILGLNQSGIPNAAVFTNDYRQWDFSSSADLSKLFGWGTDVQATLNVINLFQAKQRTYFQFTNAPFTEYNPGRQILVGVRGRF